MPFRRAEALRVELPEELRAEVEEEEEERLLATLVARIEQRRAA